MANLKETLVDAIEYEGQRLGVHDSGSPEQKAAVDIVTRLTDEYVKLEETEIRRREIDLKEAEMKAKENKADIEQQRLDLEREKAKNEKKDKIVQTVVHVVLSLVGTGVTLGCFIASMNFERNDTFTMFGSKKAANGVIKF